MDAAQEMFLRDEFFTLTLAGTVQRGRVYKPQTPEKEHWPFQNGLRRSLEEIAKKYDKEVLEEKHIQNIAGLSDALSRSHKDVLKDGRFRIGSAQKAINLYLKYLWCIGKIPMPPHCPFDRAIIDKLSTYRGPTWTALVSVEEYRNLIASAKEEARDCPLSVWELRIYNGDTPDGSGWAGPTMTAAR